MVDTLEIELINTSGNPSPAHATAGASGMDIRAHIAAPIALQPMERVAVPTGIYIKIPPGYEAQVRPRSGMALTQGITCLNTPGTIDSDYRGEIKVILINLSNAIQTINNADRMAQLVIQKIERVQWLQVEALPTTERGTGGFGHTGKQ